jgi:hypothetical protein
MRRGWTQLHSAAVSILGPSRRFWGRDLLPHDTLQAPRASGMTNPITDAADSNRSAKTCA